MINTLIVKIVKIIRFKCKYYSQGKKNIKICANTANNLNIVTLTNWYYLYVCEITVFFSSIIEYTNQQIELKYNKQKREWNRYSTNGRKTVTKKLSFNADLTVLSYMICSYNEFK